MLGFARKSALVVCALALVLAGTKSAAANIIRVIGPTSVINEPEGLIKFDVAFDTINQVYLAVWGTQAPNLHGQFLNVNGQPLGSIFNIKNLSGWARVTYSAQQQRFMVGYSSITFWPPAGNTEPPMHARYIKFVTFNPATNGPNIGPEIFLDFVGSSPGNSTGVAYSAAYGVFFATWHKYVIVPGADWAVPRSYVAAIAPDGTLLAVNELTNPFMGQSDPNIACGNSGRCLVVGFGWNNAAWGRLIDGPLATPVGEPWDIAVTPNNSQGNPVGTLGDATVAYSQLQDKFVVLYVRNFNTIWGKTVGLDGTATGPYVVLQSTPATEALVGPGYGVPNLSYNTGTSSFLVSGRDYFGRSDAQETDSGGLPIAGSWDQLPPVGESQYVNTAADPISRRMALFDNQNFNSIRIALYEIGDPRLLNGNFSDGTNNWGAWAAPDMDNIVTNLTGGVYQFYKTVPSGESNTAVVYNDTNLQFGSGARLSARFDLGNSSSVSKTISVMLHTSFNDAKVCTFTLPANTPLRTYNMRAITSMGWSRASILFEALTAGSDGGFYLLDNVSLAANPGGTNTSTECGTGPGSAGAPKADANGDGTSDILWRHANGSSAIWLMNGVSLAASAGLIGPDTGWSFAQTADLNGDGKSDILWQNTNGSSAAWLMNGVTATTGGLLIGPGTGWAFKMAGDFNGDGRKDILWQHTDGGTALWLMNGLAAAAGAGLGGAGTGWSAAQVGDFNGDGKSDIVWLHTDGSVAASLMDGTVSGASPLLLGPATGWSVRQIGDFNGDGKSDIVWQHTDGRTALWLMNGLTAASGGALLGPGTGWSAVQVGDFNGDGTSDILWQHADGRTAMWLMNGLTAVAGNILTGPGSGWHVALVGDFNGDGKCDILWQHADGSSAVWLMNGVVATSQAGMLGPATGWSPIP